MGRINDKIIEIEKYLQELDEILPENYQKYINNTEKRLACERAFEKIIEAVVDLTFLVIKENNLKIPDEEITGFDILEKGGIISEEISKKLKEAKGMRNILSHQYGNIDNEIVFESITERIIKDAKEFINVIKGMK